MKSPDFLFREALAAKPCPTAGTGCHAWLFWAACTADECKLEDAAAILIIEAAMSRPPAPANEVEDALHAARNEERAPTMKWPPRDMELVQKLLLGAEWPLEPTSAGAAQAVPLLFPGDPLVCIGKTSSDFTTGLLSDFKFLDRYSLIVPSPMSASEGKTKAGHMSKHSLDNTGPRHYLIVEFDWGKIEGQLKLLRHLANHGLLIMVVHSGSKSAHGWFDVRAMNEARCFRFFTYAVSLGADPRLWLKSQFCRMPGGTRDDGREQKILFLADEYLRDRGTFIRKPLEEKEL